MYIGHWRRPRIELKETLKCGDKWRSSRGKKNQQMKQNKQPQVEGEIVVWSLNRKRFLKQGITDNPNYHRKP